MIKNSGRAGEGAEAALLTTGVPSSPRTHNKKRLENERSTRKLFLQTQATDVPQEKAKDIFTVVTFKNNNAENFFFFSKKKITDSIACA